MGDKSGNIIQSAQVDSFGEKNNKFRHSGLDPKSRRMMVAYACLPIDPKNNHD